MKALLRLAVCLLGILWTANLSNASSGYVSVSEGVSVTPSTVVLNENFTIDFTLAEVQGAPITFEQVAVAILRSDGSHLFDLATYSNVTLPAYGSWTRSPEKRIYDSNPPGTYQAVIRGRVAGGSWFDFSVTGSGENPFTFSVVAPPGILPSIR